MEIKVLHKQGHSLRQIAQAAGVSINTLRKYLARPDAPQYKSRPPVPHQLDEFKEYIRNQVMAAKPHMLPGPVIFRKVAQMGYTGGLRCVQAYPQELKQAEQAPEPLVRFETAPGDRCQVDCVEFRKGRKPPGCLRRDPLL